MIGPTKPYSIVCAKKSTIQHNNITINLPNKLDTNSC
jgi:hypothetical protein